ncbi:MAG: RecX family transcriptional regulator [Anaeroplasmataceae bacterium]|nr:RecX family transcriptional regulator [Anaeroplasmataceae bacterium]
MIVKKLSKLEKELYEVLIEDKSYIFDEASVLKFRLFEGYEISTTDLEACIKADEFERIKKKAYHYYVRYQKNSYEIIAYLTDREVSYPLAKEAVLELKQQGLLKEEELAFGIASRLARNSNGPMMIRYKLKLKHFPEEIIQSVLEKISEEDIEEGKQKLINKLVKKNSKLSSYEQQQKRKEAFYRHGYFEG